jgi:hypothetical protein
LGAPPFLLAPFFEAAVSGATGALCSAGAAVSVVLVAVEFLMAVFILSAVDPRITFTTLTAAEGKAEVQLIGRRIRWRPGLQEARPHRLELEPAR